MPVEEKQSFRPGRHTVDDGTTSPRNITPNTADPGANDTGYADDELLRRIAARGPMGRWGSLTTLRD